MDTDASTSGVTGDATQFAFPHKSGVTLTLEKAALVYRWVELCPPTLLASLLVGVMVFGAQELEIISRIIASFGLSVAHITPASAGTFSFMITLMSVALAAKLLRGPRWMYSRFYRAVKKEETSSRITPEKGIFLRAYLTACYLVDRGILRKIPIPPELVEEVEDWVTGTAIWRDGDEQRDKVIKLASTLLEGAAHRIEDKRDAGLFRDMLEELIHLNTKQAKQELAKRIELLTAKYAAASRATRSRSHQFAQDPGSKPQRGQTSSD